MKQKDIALLIVVVFISAVVSLLVSKTLFTSPKHRQQPVEVVDPITDNFPPPDEHYFNKDSVDPTKIIKIGDNSNPVPFNGQPQQ